MSSSTNLRLGLSLSGGGYRATAFHLGTLKKLQSMQLLDKVDVLSTISGGSIIGAYYCLNKDDFTKFENELYSKLQYKNVIKRVFLSWTFIQLILFVLLFLIPAFYFLFTNNPWIFLLFFILFFVLLFLFQFNIFPVSDRIEKIYDQFFFNNKTLQHLPERPFLVLGSTNLQTARAFSFSRSRMQDSTYEFMKPPIRFSIEGFPISRAVMASSCVPFAFTPVKIDKKYFENTEDYNRVHPVLVDGGVYDNQGIHKIMQKGKLACHFVITSDAGTGKPGESNSGTRLSYYWKL